MGDKNNVSQGDPCNQCKGDTKCISLTRKVDAGGKRLTDYVRLVSVSGCIYVGDAERAWVRLCVT
eukprot:1183770-Prorocentrum_minimum.AAC.1